VFLKKIHEEREQAHKHEIEDRERKEIEAREAKRLEEEKKAKAEEESKLKEEAERKKIREERLHRRNRNKFVDYDGDLCTGDDHDSNDTSNVHGDEQEKDDLKPEIQPEGDIKEEGAIGKLNDTEPETEEIKRVGDPKSDIKLEASETNPLTVKLKEEPEEKIAVKSDNRRKSKALLLDWDTEERMTRLKSTGLYKLGQEGGFKNYTNFYAEDRLAVTKVRNDCV